MSAELSSLQVGCLAAGAAVFGVWRIAAARGRDLLGPRPGPAGSVEWVVPTVGFVIFYVGLPVATGAATGSPEMSEASKWWVRTALQVAAALAIAALARRMARDAPPPSTSLGRRAAAGVLGGLAMYTIVTGLAVAVAALWRAFPEQDAVKMLRESTGYHRAALATYALGAAPLFEEALYRGALLPALCGFMPPRTALAVQAAVFGAVHVTSSALLPVALPLAAVGWICGWLALRTGSLVVPVLAHATFNAVNVAAILAA